MHIEDKVKASVQIKFSPSPPNSYRCISRNNPQNEAWERFFTLFLLFSVFLPLKNACVEYEVPLAVQNPTKLPLKN